MPIPTFSAITTTAVMESIPFMGIHSQSLQSRQTEEAEICGKATIVESFHQQQSMDQPCSLRTQRIAKEKEESGAMEEEEEGEQETNEQGEGSDEEQQQPASEDVNSSQPMSDDDELSGPDDMDED
ncbi:MAG: hypothetical protein J3Q66DRAFT_370764 [Benniella sp.]|nr:MAG: hypothetical protein J3Q66DRAFT_370764 [Benniella sp.]